MTRDEFMKIAYEEIDQMLVTQRNRMIGLVERAWAEGKKNAEVSGIEDIVKEAIEKIYDTPEAKEWLPHTIPSTIPDIHDEHILDLASTSPMGITEILNACGTCANHPSNGGNGNCNCIKGITALTGSTGVSGE